jgi:tetraacyldisaccharide 4'-kinase
MAAAFGLLVRVRRAAYGRGILAQHRLDRPVIVVGNISVGGTGKTPLVVWLCERLRRSGLTPGVVLRGYGGRRARRLEPLLVSADSDALQVGDEALLLCARTSAPVVVGRDRVQAARRAIAAGAEVIIADDGLQHLALGRDVELAVLDAGRPLGNAHLLPAGPLREPAERLAHVDAVVLNVDGLPTGEHFASAPAASAGVASFVMHLSGDQLLSLGGQGPTLPLTSLAGKSAHAVAGIGHPERFFARLAAAGVDVIAHPFPDHHRYRAHELEFGDALPLLMTEKDAVKCRRFEAANRWFLPVEASFAEAEAAALMALIEARITQPLAERRAWPRGPTARVRGPNARR